MNNKILLILLSFISIMTLSQSSYEESITFFSNGEYSKSISGLEKRLSESNDDEEIADLHSKLGVSYYMIGVYDKAIQNVSTSLTFYEKNGDYEKIGNCYNNLGAFYEVQDKHEQSLKFFTKSLEISIDMDDTSSISSSLNNIGCVKMNLNMFDESLRDLNKSLDINKSMGDDINIIVNYRNIGNLYHKKGDYVKSIWNHKIALSLSEEIGDDHSIMESLQNLGSDYIKIGEYKKSISFLEKSLEKNTDIYYRSLIYSDLSIAYDSLGDYKNSLECNRVYNDLKDSLQSTDNQRYTSYLEIKYETLEKEKEIESVKNENDLKNIQIEKQKSTNILLIVIVILVIISVVIISIYYKRIKKSLGVNVEISEKLTIRNKEIVQYNEDIKDSMNYAKNIQDGILSSEEKFRENISNSFVMFQPKDIVSGDFYWTLNDGDNQYFASVDCTGHGIPGAMISVIGHTGLTRSVKNKGIVEPSDILSDLNSVVSETFDRDHKIKDGMDISLCVLDKKTNKLKCSMANNPVYIVRDINGSSLDYQSKKIGNKILYRVPADRQYVGCGIDFKFNQHDIQLEVGDSIYIFSDGFPDQFGGDKGKKYKYGKFQNKLIEVSDMELDVQKNILMDEFTSWKGDEDQIDDILVIGVKIK